VVERQRAPARTGDEGGGPRADVVAVVAVVEVVEVALEGDPSLAPSTRAVDVRGMAEDSRSVSG
jgi:hypothetical protein